MLISAFALLPKLIAFVALFAYIKDAFMGQLLFTLVVCLMLLVTTATVVTALVAIRLSWLIMDMYHHSRAFITIISAFKLLEYQEGGICRFVPVTIPEAFLNVVKAFARLGFMLLANMFWSVNETGLLQEVVIRSLKEARVTVVSVSF